MIGIYKITSPSGEIYVGQSVDIDKRISQHKSGNSSNKKLTASIKKYGWENHKVEIIVECDPEELNSKESEWIKFYKENYNVFNEDQGQPNYYGKGVETIVWQIQIRKDKQVEMKEAINAVRKTFKNV